MMKIVELKEEIFGANAVTADALKEELSSKGKYMINVMSSPGSGKTSTLLGIIKELQPEKKVGVIECDIDASVDARIIEEAGASSIQLHTGGMCHMDAKMTKQGIDELGIEDVDLIFIENVGNLVCPAEFDTGAHCNMTILSVPEGDDKPAKYPLIYQVCDIVLINKIDAEAVFDFDKRLAEERIHKCNPKAEILYISAKTGMGIKEAADWIRDKVNNKVIYSFAKTGE